MPRRARSPGYVEPSRIDAILRPLIPHDGDRAFVVRCVLDEGPDHHRGANYVLLAMLGELVTLLGVDAAQPIEESEPVPMRVPPHLAKAAPKAYPLGVPLAPLRGLAADDPAMVRDMVDALSDGPPQHALANAAMVHLIARALEAARRRGRDG